MTKVARFYKEIKQAVNRTGDLLSRPVFYASFILETQSKIKYFRF